MNAKARRDLMDKLFLDADFSKLKTNTQRIEYIFDKFMSFDQFRNTIGSNLQLAKQKSGKDLYLAKGHKKEADYIKMMANLDKDCNRSEECEKALQAYHKAILYTPHKQTEFLANLYSCKSLLHLELQQYPAALYAIDLALEIQDPNVSNQTPKIDYMVQKFNCLKLMEKYHSALDTINQLLQYNRGLEDFNEHVLFEMKNNVQFLIENGNIGQDQVKQEPKQKFYGYKIDPRCKIESSAVVGRHFIATEDIPEGTVLLKEMPYSIIMETEYIQKKCSNCYKNLRHKFYPCQNCTDLIFCDAKCYEQTYQLFHRHECGIVDVLKSMTSSSFHVFRMVSRVSPLDAFKAESNKNSYSIMKYLEDPSHRDVPEVYKSHEKRVLSYQMSSLLWDHDSKHNLQSNVHHTVIGIEVAVLLDLMHDYRLKAYKKKMCKSFQIMFIEMIVMDTRRIILNVFGWHEYDEDWTFWGHVANCQCLVGSLINHSCVPNTNWDFENGQIRFTTKQKIVAGGEITITYGPNKDIPYSCRQERLNHYFFACKCAACLTDARDGKSLKCLRCKGPVLFDSVVNQEPHLSGKCLECFKKYKDFEAVVKHFKKSKDIVNRLERTSLVCKDPQLANKAVKLTKLVVDLAAHSNESIIQLILTCSEIIERVVHPEDQIVKIIKFGYFINEVLPLEIKLDSTKDKTLQNMQFWLDQFVSFIIRIHQNSDLLKQYQEYQVWNALFKFHYRLQNLLKDMIEKIEEDKNSISKIAKNMIHEIVQQNHHKVENLMEQYSDNVNFIGVQ